jgi:hypothetical protein
VIDSAVRFSDVNNSFGPSAHVDANVRNGDRNHTHLAHTQDEQSEHDRRERDDDPVCVNLMEEFIRARPDLWNEDLGESWSEN